MGGYYGGGAEECGGRGGKGEGGILYSVGREGERGRGMEGGRDRCSQPSLKMLS